MTHQKNWLEENSQSNRCTRIEFQEKPTRFLEALLILEAGLLSLLDPLKMFLLSFLSFSAFT